MCCCTRSTWYELVLRYLLVLVSVLGLLRYRSSFILPKSADSEDDDRHLLFDWLAAADSDTRSIAISDWLPAQQALLLLMGANLVNNNPLFLAWVLSGAWQMQLVEKVAQSLLHHTFLLWLLVAFDGVIIKTHLDGKARQKFWLPKLLLGPRLEL